jgi:hypothetical protein
LSPDSFITILNFIGNFLILIYDKAQWTVVTIVWFPKLETLQSEKKTTTTINSGAEVSLTHP